MRRIDLDFVCRLRPGFLLPLAKMHTRRYLVFTALLLSGARWPVTAQDVREAQVPLAGCDALACSGATACTAGNESDDPTQMTLVGIAANAVNLTSDTRLSLTLVENGRTIFGNSPGLEAYERTLYIGAPSSLVSGGDDDDDRNDPPAACSLMLQYQSQTFPIPAESARGLEGGNTTSCAGVLDRRCEERFVSFIDSFASPDRSNTTSRDCTDLASHVMAAIRTDGDFLCDRYYSNLITVTGAPLLNKTGNRDNDNDDNNECRPTLPADEDRRLYRVGSVQTVVEAESDANIVGDSVFGGRQGYTPVITAVYSGEGGNLDSVQFACMQALRTSGEVLEATSMAVARGAVGFTAVGLAAVMSISVLLL